ncbi:MAG: orotate phosphoribosyltransferase [Bacteroidota bacterium]
MLSEKEIAKKLLAINAIKLQPESPFTWASGRKSPIYCDNRMTLSHPAIRNDIKTTLAESARTAFGEFDLVAGVATAGIPHGVLVAEALDLPFIYVRSSTKKHGARNRIEGDPTQGDKCLVVEDLISTGGSCLEAVDVLREAEYDVAGVIAIFTYGFEDAKSNFAKNNCEFRTISNYKALLSAALEMDYLTEDQLESLSEWSQNPIAWSDSFEK